MQWKERLGSMLGQHQGGPRSRRAGREEVLRFLQETVAPALQEVAEELKRHDREAEVEVKPDQVSITVFHGEDEEFYYAVRARTYQRPTFAFPELSFKGEGKDSYTRAEIYLREGSQSYGIMGYERTQVIANFMHEYDKQLRWQKPTRPGP